MPRQARLDYPGALHHVIGRGIDGAYIFKEIRDKQEFLSRLKGILKQKSLRIYAWCLMGNHFHLLIQTGKTSLAEIMRSLLTGYAIYFNKVHQRKGYLFQNRYKSILCERDEYLLPLIRYIHLNPVKAKMVTLAGLGEYAWTSHRELIEKNEESLIDQEEVLGYFGERETQAKRIYLEYLKEGLQEKEDFMGGGLIRSLGGIENALKVDRGQKQAYDERILGTGGFIDDVLSRLEKEDHEERSFKDMDDLLERLGWYYRIKKEEILNSRMKAAREARNVLVYLGNAYLGKNMTAMGETLGIKQPAASRARGKGREIVAQKSIVKGLLEIKL